VDEAARTTGFPRRERDKFSRPEIIFARRLLCRAETFTYWLVVAPLLAHLPARLAYRAACWRADQISRYWPDKSREAVHNLRQVLGSELGQEEAERVVRDLLRFASCAVIDLMLLRDGTRPLAKLVEIRGREHLKAALADGKGAILCSAHYGSHMSGFSLLHASGSPVTSIARWWWNYESDKRSVQRFWALNYARRVLRYRQRPNIEPWPGRLGVAAQAASALRDNEVVTIGIDSAPVDADIARTIDVPFLGHQARLLPGVVTLARLTGAPVLMTFMYRSADYRHQVLEISPPVPMDGDTATAFQRCVAAVEAAIRKHPANWEYWFEPDDLAKLGLLPDDQCPAVQAADQADQAGEFQQSAR
jgi:lauroyl/myristoyl acyltransferase